MFPYCSPEEYYQRSSCLNGKLLHLSGTVIDSKLKFDLNTDMLFKKEQKSPFVKPVKLKLKIYTSVTTWLFNFKSIVVLYRDKMLQKKNLDTVNAIDPTVKIFNCVVVALSLCPNWMMFWQDKQR